MQLVVVGCLSLGTEAGTVAVLALQNLWFLTLVDTTLGVYRNCNGGVRRCAQVVCQMQNTPEIYVARFPHPYSEDSS